MLETILEDPSEKQNSMKVIFEIKVLCATDLNIPDGTAVQVAWSRGTQTLETNVKLVQNKRAYF